MCITRCITKAIQAPKSSSGTTLASSGACAGWSGTDAPACAGPCRHQPASPSIRCPIGSTSLSARHLELLTV